MKYVALVFCLIAGVAHADGFYIDGGLSALRSRGSANVRTVTVVTHSSYNSIGERLLDGWSEATTVSGYQPYDINRVRNPYGSLSLGYDWRWNKFAFDFELRHQSSIAAGDHGEDSVGIKLRWYPFN